MTNVLFSVIVPTYDRWPLLQEAVGSALGQTCAEAEILVVDDGSSDETRERAAALGEPVRLLTCDRGGPARARNVALREARGELIAFLDSDDLWLTTHLADARDLFASRPDVEFAFTDARFVSKNGVVRESYLRGKPIETVPFDQSGAWRVFRRTIYPELVLEPCVATSSVIARRSTLERVGGFDERWNLFGEDNDLWMRIAASSKAACKWTVSVERRKLGGNYVIERDLDLRLSQHIRLIESHGRGVGREHQPFIRRRLAALHMLRARARIRVGRPAGVLDLARAVVLRASSGFRDP